MPKKFSQRADDLRRALAQEAARVMAQQGIGDFLQAKRKAAAKLGVHDAAVLPKNTEIEAALRDYQRLFGEPPGPIIFVGVMTDTNATGTEAIAYYGDIRFTREE